MIPRPIYEALPYLYFFGGITAALGLDPTSGRFSGILLIIAGLVIYEMRQRHRQKG